MRGDVTMSSKCYSILRYALCVLAAAGLLMLQTEIGGAFSVTVPFGTPVSLRVQERIHPSTNQVGQSVVLVADRDVVVEGKVVVRAGARATAEVTRSTKRGEVGKPAEIAIEAKSVEAVDGTMLALDGTKLVAGESKQTSSLVITLLCCLLGLLQQGEDAEIMAGSLVDATVQGAQTVEVQ
jgi:uncharacterized Zn-binding protein involved in type VI secretion